MIVERQMKQKKRRKKLSYALILVNLRGKTKVCAGKNICCILN